MRKPLYALLLVCLTAVPAFSQGGSVNIDRADSITTPLGTINTSAAATVTALGTANTSLALIDNLPNTLGSTTSGQSGALILGAVTTSAPSYTNATSNALSLQTDGALRVACAGCSGTGASAVDDAAFTVASGAVAPAGFLFDDVSPDSVNEGDVGLGRMSANRNQYFTIRDAAGNERGVNVTASNELSVLPTGLSVAQASTTSGQVGTLIQGAVTTSAPSYTNGQTSPLSLTPGGLLRAAVLSGGPTEVVEGSVYSAGGNVGLAGIRRCNTPGPGTGVADGDVMVPCGSAFGVPYATLVDGSGAVLTYGQDRTEDAAEAGGETGPLFLGVRRDTAASSSGTAGDFSTLNLDGLGRLWTRAGDPCADFARVTSAAISTSSSGNTQLVALSSGQTVYVCGYKTVSAGAVSANFIYGTGTACATGETAIEGPSAYAANGGALATNAGAVQFKTAVSNALCIKLSAGVQTGGYVTYVQTAAP